MRREGRPLAGRRIALIGLGLMGRPMARNLLAAGAELLVSSRSRGPVEALLTEGAAEGACAADMVETCEAVLLCLPDTPSVLAVAEASGGLLDGVARRAGGLVIDTGTTAPAATSDLAKAVAARGGAWVDAPVSGGAVGAETATLSVMAGGSVEALAAARPILEVLSARITHVGGPGAGQVAKAVNQVIVGLTIGAVAEGLALGAAAGVDPALIREAMAGGFAQSRILELHGERMVTGSFAPGGKASTQLKDLRQALDLARDVGLDMPATELGARLYERLVERGDGGLDHAALYRLYTVGRS